MCDLDWNAAVAFVEACKTTRNSVNLSVHGKTASVTDNKDAPVTLSLHHGPNGLTEFLRLNGLTCATLIGISLGRSWNLCAFCVFVCSTERGEAVSKRRGCSPRRHSVSRRLSHPVMLSCRYTPETTSEPQGMRCVDLLTRLSSHSTRSESAVNATKVSSPKTQGNSLRMFPTTRKQFRVALVSTMNSCILVSSLSSTCYTINDEVICWVRWNHIMDESVFKEAVLYVLSVTSIRSNLSRPSTQYLISPNWWRTTNRGKSKFLSFQYSYTNLVFPNCSFDAFNIYLKCFFFQACTEPVPGESWTSALGPRFMFRSVGFKNVVFCKQALDRKSIVCMHSFGKP